MPTNIPIVSFNSGKLSPQIDERVDIEKYSSGCRDMDNFIPRVYGSAEERPGTRFVANAKNSDLTVRMIPFQFSDTIAYMCEFGESYIRFFFDGGRLVGSTSPAAWADATAYIIGQFVTLSAIIYRCLVAHTSVTGAGDGSGGEPNTNFTQWVVAALTSDSEPIAETPTPYQEADLLELQIRQIADVMWIVHKNYQPRKLSRTTATSFDLSAIVINDGPFKKRNDLENNDDVTITPSAKRNHNLSNSINYARSLSDGVATVESGTGSESGNITNINDGDLTSFYRRTSSGTTTVFRSWKTATAAMLAKVTLDSATDITKVTYDIDWISNPGLISRTLLCQIQQAGIWTTIGTSTAETVTILGTFDAVTAVRINMSGTTDYHDSPTMSVTLNELEAWGTAATVTLTSSSAVFNSSHIGALFQITHPRETTAVTGSSTTTSVGAFTAAIDVKGEFSTTTDGTWDKVIQLQRNVNGEGWETFRTWQSKSGALRNINQTYTEDDNNVQYRMFASEATSGTVTATIRVHTPTQSGIGRVTAFTSSTVVTIDVLTPFASLDASFRWSEGAWSNDEGFPGAFTFFEERAIYGGTTVQPQTIWLSKSGFFENFDEGTNDDSAFLLTMGSDKRNGIRWLSALEALLIGTNGGEWRMRATAFDEKLTPSNFNLRQQTSYGSKKIQPLAVGTSVLFVDFVGRKIRELTFKTQSDKFVAPDLSALAEDITLGGITTISFQKNPDLILWTTLSGGKPLTMVYERDQNVIAWAEHTLGGTDAAADSIARIPGTNEDEIWLCVAKTVDGSTVRHIEQMQPRVNVSFEDSWYVDDGLKFDGGDTVNITGVTNADPCVVTAPSHGKSNGNHIFIASVGGTTELNGTFFTIDNKTDNTFQLRTYVKNT